MNKVHFVIIEKVVDWRWIEDVGSIALATDSGPQDDRAQSKVVNTKMVGDPKFLRIRPLDLRVEGKGEE